MEMERYQLTVIGGGPGGYAAALHAAALGLKTILIEREHLGGTCLNHGCIPTKSLAYSAFLYRKLKEAHTYGFDTGVVSFDYAAIEARKASVVSELVGRLAGLLKSAGVEVCFGEARALSPVRFAVQLPGGEKRVVETEQTILATGSEEIIPPVPGINLPGVIYSREALALTRLPVSLAVVGGGVIALEMASIFAAFGVSVTIIQRSILLRREDREMVRRLTPFLRRQGIKIMTEAPLQRIVQDGDGLRLVVHTMRGEEAVIAEKVLIAIGRKASSGGLEPAVLGIAAGEAGFQVAESMETNVPGIYAVGDAATPGFFLAHVASHQGIVAAENAAGREVLFHANAVPVCIFTHPELARVGLTEEEAREKGYPVRTGKFPFSANGKAFLQGEGDGVVKIVADGDTGTVLGVHILGPHASDLIQEGTLAVAYGARVDDLQQLIHPHPTLSEALWEAALSVTGAPLHLESRR
ncbi:MAG: dihydrolipoyl dehydrogenase [Bacillota bacterium]